MEIYYRKPGSRCKFAHHGVGDPSDLMVEEIEGGVALTVRHGLGQEQTMLHLRASEAQDLLHRLQMLLPALVVVLALVTGCGVPEVYPFDGAVSDSSTFLDALGSDAATTFPDGGLDGFGDADAAATLDASLDGGVDAAPDLPASDAGVTDAMTACVDTWPLRSGAIATYGCALPPDNVCTSMSTVPTADVEACEAALRAASACEDIDVPACWYVSPSAPLDGGDCIHGTPSSVCMDPSNCREHRGIGFVCLLCCP